MDVRSQLKAHLDGTSYEYVLSESHNLARSLAEENMYAYIMKRYSRYFVQARATMSNHVAAEDVIWQRQA